MKGKVWRTVQFIQRLMDYGKEFGFYSKSSGEAMLDLELGEHDLIYVLHCFL